MHSPDNMINEEASRHLRASGIAETPNRVLVVRALARSYAPMSLAELEDELDSLDKSSIHRVLNVLLEHDVVHAIEDGRGISKYELCYSDNDLEDSDMHCHFYCNVCRRTFCIPHSVPKIAVPANFTVTGINYMLKGICPDCASKHSL